MVIGMGEIIVILILLAALVGLIFAAMYSWSKILNTITTSFKTCPHCAERIQKAAIICRYCQRDVTDVEIENKPPRGLFQ